MCHLVRQMCRDPSRNAGLQMCTAAPQAYISQTRRRLLLTPYNDYLNVHLMVLRQACSTIPLRGPAQFLWLPWMLACLVCLPTTYRLSSPSLQTAEACSAMQRAQMYYVTVLGVGMVPVLWYTR